jgi:hypothetical protein
MRRDCLITYRLAGPCRCCRQPAWPVHAQSDGRILCARCCGCGQCGAQAAGADAPTGQGETQVPPRDSRRKQFRGEMLRPQFH